MPDTKEEFSSLVLLTSCRLPLGVCLWSLWVLLMLEDTLSNKDYQLICHTLVHGAGMLSNVRRGGDVGVDGLTEIGVWPNSPELLNDPKTIPFAPNMDTGLRRIK
jgi:hypothetical protein